MADKGSSLSTAVVTEVLLAAEKPLSIVELVRRIQSKGVQAPPGEIKGKIFSLTPDPVAVTADFEYELKEKIA